MITGDEFLFALISLVLYSQGKGLGSGFCLHPLPYSANVDQMRYEDILWGGVTGRIICICITQQLSSIRGTLSI